MVDGVVAENAVQVGRLQHQTIQTPAVSALLLRLASSEHLCRRRRGGKLRSDLLRIVRQTRVISLYADGITIACGNMRIVADAGREVQTEVPKG
jgi:hypothetical protein